MAKTGLSDAEKLSRLREQLPAVAKTGYFNAGTNGPLSTVAYKAIVETAEQELNDGRIIPGVYEGHAKQIERIRLVLADIFNADPTELALTRSTNDGLNIALNGITWNRGDEVITTNLEHPSLFTPLALLAHRYGIVIRVIDIGNGGGDVVATLERAMTSRTRVLAFSHVMWSSGAIMPLHDISAMAHRHNALVIVDAAQSAGQVKVDLHATGVDAYAMAGQKWLCGPEGTGVLYVATAAMPEISPSHIRYGQSDTTGYVIPAPGARRYEMGECYSPAMVGMEATLAWLRDEVGMDWAFARTRALAQRFAKGIGAIDGVDIFSPLHRIGGLVCFNVPDMTPQDLTKALYERGQTIRYVAYPPGPTIARASIAWWNTEAEVDLLAKDIADIVEKSEQIAAD